MEPPPVTSRLGLVKKQQSANESSNSDILKTINQYPTPAKKVSSFSKITPVRPPSRARTAIKPEVTPQAAITDVLYSVGQTVIKVPNEIRMRFEEDDSKIESDSVSLKEETP